jgi:L-threonylcarbamoyladenylate synthase
MLSDNDINTAAETVFKGGVVIIPTDTIYGFSCDPRNEYAVDRIRGLKERDNKPFIILDSSLERIRNSYFSSDKFIHSIIELFVSEKLWPGRITLIADKNSNLGFKFLKDHKKIAVRYVDNEVVGTICGHIGFGIVSTSINISGEEELNDISGIKSAWSKDVDCILERDTAGNSPSAIIELFSDEKALKFIRIGDQETRVSIENIISGKAEICL